MSLVRAIGTASPGTILGSGVTSSGETLFILLAPASDPFWSLNVPSQSR